MYNLVTFGPETSEFTLLTIAPFVAIRQKSAYYAKYLRIFWTYFDLLYRFGRRISGDDFHVFVWRSPKGRCYGNQLNMGDVCKRRVGPTLHFASAVDKIAQHESRWSRFGAPPNSTVPNAISGTSVSHMHSQMVGLPFDSPNAIFY